MFMVSVDGEGKQDPTVHKVDCFIYKNRKGGRLRWYGPYIRFTEAWKLCFQHAQDQNRIPKKHNCVE
jgi:hypothetical protein